MSRLTDHDDFRALRPFFRIVEEALIGIVDGADFFDMLAERLRMQVAFERICCPRRQGQEAMSDRHFVNCPTHERVD